jgi:C4-type zinc ribbon domain
MRFTLLFSICDMRLTRRWTSQRAHQAYLNIAILAKSLGQMLSNHGQKMWCISRSKVFQLGWMKFNHPPMKELTDNLLKLQALEFDKALAADDDRITALRKKIPPSILAHYDHLADRGKKGVALVRNNVCTGCHMQVTLAVTMNLLHDTNIQTCESCGRYLYLATPAETPKAVRRKKAAAATASQDSELQAV